jgi:hypothetical protein
MSSLYTVIQAKVELVLQHAVYYSIWAFMIPFTMLLSTSLSKGSQMAKEYLNLVKSGTFTTLNLSTGAWLNLHKSSICKK